jgi:hypothetical protein
MTPAPYTEDTLVQQTTAEYLEKQLGWRSVYAYNNEDFAPDSLPGRHSGLFVERRDRASRLLRQYRQLYSIYPDIWQTPPAKTLS